MACTFILSQKERLYLLMEGAGSYGTIPNTSGTSTLAGSNYCRHISLEFSPTIDLYTRQDKTGTLSYPAGTPGRESGAWKASMSLAANGVSGVLPDCDPLLQCLFGKAATVTASTSVAYGLSDNIPSCNIWSFRTDTAGTGNPNQHVGVGSIVNEATFTLGQDIATVDYSGISRLVLNSFTFTARGTAGDTAGQSGLTTYPTEPTTPVSNGNAAQGFYGALTLDGQSMATIRTATVKFSMQRKLSKIFGSRYGSCPIAGRRKITFSCELYDASDTQTKDLYQRNYDKNTFGATIVIGSVAGNIWTLTLAGLQLAPYRLNDPADDVYTVEFTDSMATSQAGLTEASLVIT